jgi:hypothetical protein
MDNLQCLASPQALGG